ncbi:hypothetical protein B0H15DRAFT_919919 [Mycena belliarum]|uniref:FAD-binding PCMH-type domain-containing protein n=1 Tax=Mycena belliarum TaxID=1033014 RepID=A0AAD6UES5_9AGAR|nr:hypothetical protein B0H15DRAFT_919919 [Mycena belliae]
MHISLCATAQNITILQHALSTSGVSAVYLTDKNYTNVSQAFNKRFTISPIAVVFPTSVEQVSAAVAAGADQNLEVVARSGGHSYIANGLGGKNGSLVVDMSKLKSITVRSFNNTAVIETGNRLRDVALALNAKGRALPHRTCSYMSGQQFWVGIGGHSGYGGFGFTSRAWGLLLDTVRSATVVLGNCTIISASANVNSDLFWIPTTSTSIAAFQKFASTNIPPEFGAELVFGKGPSSGKVSFGLTGAYYSNPTALNSILAPYLKALPKVSSNTTMLGSYINSVAVLSGSPLNTSTAPDGSDTFYTKSLMTPEGAPMSSAAITVFVTYMAKQGFSSKTDWFVDVELYGGANSAINAVPLDATAFAKRDTLFTIQFYASSATGKPPYPGTGFTFMDGMVASIVNNSPSNWNYGAYLNYIDDRLANTKKLYYGTHYPRLESIKAAVDPQNTFCYPVGVA